MNNQRWRHGPNSRQSCSGIPRFVCAAAVAGQPPMTCDCVTHEPAPDGPLAAAEAALAADRAVADPAIWITRIADEDVLAQAEVLELEGRNARPLWGLTVAVKDNIDVAGLPTTAACPDYAHVPTESAPSVRRLLDAGALLLGKTNLDQFATGLVGVRSPYGTPRNVFNAQTCRAVPRRAPVSRSRRASSISRWAPTPPARGGFPLRSATSSA